MPKIIAVLVALTALLAQLFTLQHCATPTRPSGGPRDSIPPQLVAERSTPNFRTDFRPERIELTFDEWVTLDPQQEIIVSPPIVFPPAQRPQLRGKTLAFDLTGIPLRDSVTYVFNIGAAVQDVNEKNPTENLRFVFSTGPVLDTATVSGTLVDAYSGEPLEKTVFALFGNLADTAVYRENPTYFAQSDEAGRFTVYNVRPGTYRAVALLRNPGSTNYFLDFDGTFRPQSVGFVDTLVTVGPVATAVGAVRLSPVPVPVRITGVDSSAFGVTALTFNQPAEGVSLRYRGDYLRRNLRDTAYLYYRATPPADTVLAGLDTVFMDTLALDFGGREAGAVPGLVAQRGSAGRLNPGEGYELIFNRPIEKVDTAAVNLFRDTLDVRLPLRYGIDTTYPGRVRFAHRWVSGVPYRLELLPGAVTDWLGQPNRDTITDVLNFDDADRFGKLTLNLTNLQPASWYIVRLLKGDEVVTTSQRVIRDRFETTLVYESLRPETYRLEVVFDLNRNGLYDGADFRYGRQAEAVRRLELQPLRANWEVEKSIDLGASTSDPTGG